MALYADGEGIWVWEKGRCGFEASFFVEKVVKIKRKV